MVKSYLVVPASDLENGVPTTLANAILDADGSLTGLTNGTEYRAYLLDSTALSPAILPTAVVAAAVAAGALADQTYTQGTGVQTVDASSDFTGAVGGSWSVSGAGASIDPSGVVTIPTDTLRSAATVTVTYTNPGGAASSAFSVTVEAATATPIVEAQTASFGAQTLSGAGGYQITDSSGAPITNAADAGTGTATGYTLSSGGVITPSSDGALAEQDGATINISCDQGTATVTLDVAVNTYSASSFADLDAAMLHAQANNLTAGSTIRLEQDIDNTAAASIASSGSTTPVFSPPLTITGAANRTKIGKRFDLRHWGGVTIRGIEFDGYDTSVTELVTLSGDCRDIVFDDYHIHGVTRDINGDYSASGSYVNITEGIVTVGTGRGYPGGITMQNGLVEHVNKGGNVKLGRAGGFTFKNNEQRYLYADGVHYSVRPEGFDVNNEYAGPIIYEDNITHNCIGDPADVDNPHVDMLAQHKSGSNGRILNARFSRNFASENSAARARSSQGLTSFEDSGFRAIFVDPLIEDNVIALSGNHHVTMQVDGARCRRNTLVQAGPTFDKVPTLPPRFMLAAAAGATGVVEFTANITEGVASVTNPDGTDYGNVTLTDNVVLGLQGATISYASAFIGAGWDDPDPAVQQAAFVIIPGGPADVKGTEPSGSLIQDSGFDDPSEWIASSGFAVQGGVLNINSPAAFDRIVSSGVSGKTYDAVTGGQSYRFSIDVTRVAVGGRIRMELQYFTGPTSTDPLASVTLSGRIGGSTITVSATGTLGPYALPTQPPADCTHVKLDIIAIDTGLDLDLDNAVLELI